MKKKQFLTILVTLLASMGLTSCATPKEIANTLNWSNRLEIETDGKTFKVNEKNNFFNLEEGEKVYLKVRFFKRINASFAKEINISSSNSNVDISFSYRSYLENSLNFLLKVPDISSNNKIDISYIFRKKSYRYSFTFDSVKYDLAKHGYSQILDADLKKKESFKKTIDSVKKHQFVEPYLSPDKEYVFDHRLYFNDEFFHDSESDAVIYNTDYLNYLTDSLYCPTYFDLVPENELAWRDLSINYPGNVIIEDNMPQTKIGYLALTYGVVDPKHTGPTSSLYQTSFYAFAKDIDDEAMKKTINLYKESLSLDRFKKYIEVFRDYQNEEISISLIKTSNTYIAIYEDASYDYYIDFYWNE